MFVRLARRFASPKEVVQNIVHHREYQKAVSDLANLDNLVDLRKQYSTNPKNDEVIEKYIKGLRKSGFYYEAELLALRQVKTYRFKDFGKTLHFWRLRNSLYVSLGQVSWGSSSSTTTKRHETWSAC